MLSRGEYIRLSLELNLFFARISKEHSIFLESAFTYRDMMFAKEADKFKVQFEGILAETISLSNGVISPEVVMSGELVTPLTLKSEEISSFYLGIKINTSLTQAEVGIKGNSGILANPLLEQRVFNLNQKAIAIASALAKFKSTILSYVNSCRMFTTVYPLFIAHVLDQTNFYLEMLMKLQNREEIYALQDLPEQESFWNKNLARHSKFIRGFLDPTNDNLINIANYFANEFDKLTQDAEAVTDQIITLPEVTDKSLKTTMRLNDFEATGTKGLLNCSVKGIAYPLLGDHVLRESNHYIRILKMFKG